MQTGRCICPCRRCACCRRGCSLGSSVCQRDASTYRRRRRPQSRPSGRRYYLSCNRSRTPSCPACRAPHSPHPAGRSPRSVCPTPFRTSPQGGATRRALWESQANLPFWRRPCAYGREALCRERSFAHKSGGSHLGLRCPRR